MYPVFLTPKNLAFLKGVQMKTGCIIQLPNLAPNSSRNYNNYNNSGEKSITVTGSIDGVFLAKQDITGCLPIVLMFDLKNDNTNANQQSAQKIGEKYECFINIKQKPKQSNRNCVIKSSEMNVLNMFLARQELLGCSSHGIEQMNQQINQQIQNMNLNQQNQPQPVVFYPTILQPVIYN